MFLGEYEHALDSKKRIIIPSKFREELGIKFILTKGLDGCLYAFPLSEWHILEEKLKGLPFTNKNARAFVRFFSPVPMKWSRTGREGLLFHSRFWNMQV